MEMRRRPLTCCFPSQAAIPHPNLLQRAQAAFIKKGAVIGQTLAAGGALKKTYPQPLFKASDAFSDRRA
jgi:hypothetical protein